ncbi:MAG: hypothetical protein MUE68_10950 [Bacteroidetes bacterium]|nr:hypothetical protein [Bacteroidota bacterium]
MIQPEGPRALDGYHQYLRLDVQGNTVHGVSRIEIPDTEFFAEMSAHGSIKNDTLFLTETAIVNQHAREGHFWCLKQASLGLERQHMTLSGDWHPNGMDCAPGRIELHRILR